MTSAPSATGISSPGEHGDRRFSTGPRRWPRLTWVELAQHVLRDGDVRRGDKHVSGCGSNQLGPVEARGASED